MLSPDALDRAGETVAALFAEIEAQMLDVMARSLAERDVTSMTTTAAALLAQSHRAELEELARRRWPEMDAEARAEIEELLRESDDDDAARLGSSERLYPAHAKAAADSLASILERDNLAMADAAVAAFLEKSARAILQTETGALDSERAVRLAVRDLERDGLSIVAYRDVATGRETVRNRVDVAVRRHVRTQANQAGARMTLDRLGSMGHALVEVTSHAGARPEHAEWQGRCYSLRGELTVGGVTYRDFYSATGYGRVDGLCGANCRHSFGPYLHGAPRAYEEDPEHESGLPSAEVYRLEQGQRYRERRIREAKRELRGAAIAHGAQRTPASLADLNAARALVAKRQAAMRDYIRDANARAAPGTLALRRQYHREWVGPVPGSPARRASGRKIEDVMAMPSVDARRRAAGLTKAESAKAVSKKAAEHGVAPGRFAYLPAADQRKIVDEAVPAAPKVLRRSRSIPVGGVFGSKPAGIEVGNMRTRLVPEHDIEETSVFAGYGTRTEYRKKEKLSELYGGDPEKWFHASGEAWAFDPVDGRIRKAEFHWAENDGVGIREFNYKKWVS